MTKLNFRHPHHVTPPGSMVEILAHPNKTNRTAIELALFNEHRYAFFFWAKWTTLLQEKNKYIKPPCLVSLDWHQDLVYPTTNDKAKLHKLDLTNNADISSFCWANLRSLNDTHVMSAVYLNLVADVYVHCRQGTFASSFDDELYKDKYGNVHTIRKFKTFDQLTACLNTSIEERVYFDIDLDFFTIDNPLNGKGTDFTYLSDREIRKIFATEGTFLTWIFKRLSGFTIATEPEHTGGLIIANKYLDKINKLLFDPPLFTNLGNQWHRGTRWKHLSSLN